MTTIYKIEVSDKTGQELPTLPYIGSTSLHIEVRTHSHRLAYNRRADDRPLYRYMRECGYESKDIRLIELEVLDESASYDLRLEREQHWMNACDSRKNGLNAVNALVDVIEAKTAHNEATKRHQDKDDNREKHRQNANGRLECEECGMTFTRGNKNRHPSHRFHLAVLAGEAEKGTWVKGSYPPIRKSRLDDLTEEQKLERIAHKKRLEKESRERRKTGISAYQKEHYQRTKTKVICEFCGKEYVNKSLKKHQETCIG